MVVSDTRGGYGWISILLHWVVAGLVIALFIIGEQFEDLSREAAAPLKSLHFALGVIAAGFISLRVIWRLAQGHPLVPDDPFALRLLAGIVQWSLLLLPLILVITGALSILSMGREIDVFGLFAVPSPFATPDRELHELFEDIHGVATKPLLPLVALHVLGALKHAVVNRDGVLWRMFRPASA